MTHDRQIRVFVLFFHVLIVLQDQSSEIDGEPSHPGPGSTISCDYWTGLLRFSSVVGPGCTHTLTFSPSYNSSFFSRTTHTYLFGHLWTIVIFDFFPLALWTQFNNLPRIPGIVCCGLMYRNPL